MELSKVTEPDHNFNLRVMTGAVGWLIGHGILSTIAVIAFTLSISINQGVVWTALVGGIGWLLAFVNPSFLLSCNITKARSFRVTPKEAVILSGIAITLIVYAYVALAPYHMWDPLVWYMADSKAIASGWTLNDFVQVVTSVRSDFATQVTDAHSFLAVNDTYIARFRRWIGLIACALMIWSFLRLLLVNNFWALLASLSFLLTPELMLLGVSSKPDSIACTLEIATILCLAIPIAYRKKQANFLPFFVLAAFLSSVALSSRMSSASVFALAWIALIFFLFKSKGYFGPSKSGLILFVALSIASCSLYVFNLVTLGNPFFWFQGPWPFDSAPYVNDPAWWRDQFNMYPFPAGLNHVYLILHQAIGLEPLRPFIEPIIGKNIIPSAPASAGAQGWLSPFLLAFFIAPFFFKISKHVLFMTIVFFLLFLGWYHGIHYSRVFLGGSSLLILVAALIASLPSTSLSRLQRFFRSCLRIGLVCSPLIFLPLHLFLATTRPHDITSLYSKSARYQAQVAYLESSAITDTNESLELPTYEDALRISNELRKYPNAHVLINFNRAIGALFSAGNFFYFDPYRGRSDAIDAADCLLIDNTINPATKSYYSSKGFQQTHFESPRWLFICRKPK